jgi:two-component system sensor histidine kinase KdpD
MREQMHRQMLSSVSHDLKTPLATMIGSLEIYQRMYEKLSPEKRATLVQSALMEAYRLDNFITNILDMAKLESGAVKAQPALFDLHLTLNDCVTRLGPRANQHKIRIVGNADKSPKTDAALLARAVGLLLDNATKHAGKPAEIGVEYACDGKTITIHVRDNGPGIPAGREEAIFSKYTRLTRHDQQNAGTGLGLSICRQIMVLLGGDVTLNKSAEQGAHFTLECPSVSAY